MSAGASSSAAASSQPAPKNAAARKLYEALLADPSSTHFKVLPDPFLYAQYYAVITRPICLADIQLYINSKKYTLADMQRDVRRMIANAKKYNLPESIVYQDGLAMERVVRRVVKEIEREGEADDDEDAVYARTNRDRAYFEHMEREQARAWVQQLAHRRATMAAQRAARDPARQSMEEVFQEFVEDEDLFVRGAENPVVFHARKRGRLRPPPGAASAPVGVAHSASNLKSAQKRATDGTDSSGAPTRRSAPPAHSHLSAAAPGSIANPITQTAKEEFFLRHFSDSDGTHPVEQKSANNPRGKARADAGTARSRGAASSAPALSDSVSSSAGQSAPGSDAGGWVYLRCIVNGTRMPATRAWLSCDYVAPSRSSHSRICRLCAPSLLEERTISRKGVEVSDGVGADMAREKAAARAAVLTPHFRELPQAYLQGLTTDSGGAHATRSTAALASAGRKRAREDISVDVAPSPPRAGAPSSSSIPSPIVCVGVDGDFAIKTGTANNLAGVVPRQLDKSIMHKMESSAVYKRLSKLSKELGVALVVEMDKHQLLDGAATQTGSSKTPAASRAASATPASAPHGRGHHKTPSAPPSTTANTGSDADVDQELDAAGYDASISATFWAAYQGHRATINAHPDCVVTLAKHAQPRRGRGAGSNTEASGAPGGIPALPEEHFVGERWLIRKRVHFCETHASDSHEAPRIVEGFAASSSPYAHFLLQSIATRESGTGDGGLTTEGSDTGGEDDELASFTLRERATSAGRRAPGRPAVITPASKLTAGAVAVASAILRGAPATSAELLASMASPPHGAGPRTSGTGAAAAPFDPTMLGSMIDVRDSGGSWWLAQVTDVKTRGVNGEFEGVDDDDVIEQARTHIIRVHYQGWAEEYDEWVPVPPDDVLAASMTVRKPGTKLPAPLRAAVAACRVAPALAYSGIVASTCEVCDNRRAGQLLFCDASGCDKAYHMTCLRPALTKIPTGKWYCPLHARETAHVGGGAVTVGGRR